MACLVWAPWARKRPTVQRTSWLPLGGGASGPPSFIPTNSLNWQALPLEARKRTRYLVVKNLGFGQDRCGSEPWIFHLLVVRPWTVNNSELGLPICEMEVMFSPA